MVPTAAGSQLADRVEVAAGAMISCVRGDQGIVAQRLQGHRESRHDEPDPGAARARRGRQLRRRRSVERPVATLAPPRRPRRRAAERRRAGRAARPRRRPHSGRAPAGARLQPRDQRDPGGARRAQRPVGGRCRADPDRRDAARPRPAAAVGHRPLSSPAADGDRSRSSRGRMPSCSNGCATAGSIS